MVYLYGGRWGKKPWLMVDLMGILMFFFFNGWLVVTGTMEFYIFPNSWDDDPI
jgi:hypothetical protein